PHLPVVWTSSGMCTNGSTAHHAGGTRKADSGFTAGMSTRHLQAVAGRVVAERARTLAVSQGEPYAQNQNRPRRREPQGCFTAGVVGGSQETSAEGKEVFETAR